MKMYDMQSKQNKLFSIK